MQLQLCVSYKFITEIAVYIIIYFCTAVACLPFSQTWSAAKKNSYLLPATRVYMCVAHKHIRNKCATRRPTGMPPTRKHCCVSASGFEAGFPAWPITNLTDSQSIRLFLQHESMAVRFLFTTYVYVCVRSHYKTADVKSHLIWSLYVCRYICIFHV